MSIPAFPNKGGRKFVQGNEVRISLPSDGMTLRDYFAAKSLSGYILHDECAACTCEEIAEAAYRMADAMLKERDK
jgi:hypothetical protein